MGKAEAGDLHILGVGLLALMFQSIKPVCGILPCGSLLLEQVRSKTLA